MLSEEKKIKTKKQLKEYLDCELPQYGGGGIKSLLLIGETAILRRHQFILRKTEYYSNTGKCFRTILYKIRLSYFQNKYALHIPINTCGKGLKIMHVGPILFNGKVTVGENCSFHINTNLVADGLDDSVPTLGNGVVMGVGSVVLGGVVIANNVAVGANAVVTKDILEEDIAVAGVPAKKISTNGRTKWNKKK